MPWSDKMLNSNRWLSLPRKGGPVFLRLTYPSPADPAKIVNYRASLGTNDLATARRLRNKYVIPILSRPQTDLEACRRILHHFLEEINAARPDLPRELDEALGITTEPSAEAGASPRRLGRLITTFVKEMQKPEGLHTTAPSTASPYAGIYRSFLAAVGDVPVNSLTTNRIEQYLDERLTAGARKKTMDPEILGCQPGRDHLLALGRHVIGLVPLR